LRYAGAKPLYHQGSKSAELALSLSKGSSPLKRDKMANYAGRLQTAIAVVKT